MRGSDDGVTHQRNDRLGTWKETLIPFITIAGQLGKDSQKADIDLSA